MESPSPQVPLTPEALSARCLQAARADAAALDRLTDSLCVYDTESILTFGAQAAAELGRRSDAVLQSIRADPPQGAAPLLDALGELMEHFDPAELAGEKEPKRRFLFRPASKTPEQPLESYRRLSRELDRTYIALKTYEAELRSWDSRLQALWDADLRCYQDLVRYIAAGEQGLSEIGAHLRRLESVSTGSDAALSDADRDTVRRAHTLLERRVQELRISGTAALQTLPMVQLVRQNNGLLLEKLNTAFLVTIPIFRQSLAQAVAKRRQDLQAQALEAVDRRARAALETRGAAARSRLQAEEACQAARLETLQKARETILRGIDETRALQRAAPRP